MAKVGRLFAESVDFCRLGMYTNVGLCGAGGGERGGCLMVSCIFLPQAHKCQAGLPPRITPDYNIREK